MHKVHKDSVVFRDAIKIYMSQVAKHITGTVYKPLLEKHLAEKRTYAYKGMALEIPSGVFHPKYFFSSKLLLRYILQLPLQNKTFLEPGAGSGLISLIASRYGARVTATDINPQAVDCLGNNAALNHQNIRIILSDMFESIPKEAFDIIAINPPYYPKEPKTYADYAWYCGENGEYFKALFSGLKDYVHPDSKVCMVLCDGCNRHLIHSLAGQYEWRMNYVHKKSNFLENNFIISIEPAETSHKRIVSDPDSDLSFENVYLKVRKAEQRLYSDEEVRKLPELSPLHPHYKEWLVRKDSARKLIRYLSKKRKPLRILDIGCGNGWLTHRLSVIPQSRITGVETNSLEFQQAKRLFSGKSNLEFIHRSLTEIAFHGELFDIVVLAASLQYFSSVQDILEYILQHYLKPEGEVHVIDSPFYLEKELPAARERTIKYYTQLGFREMIPFYFHHSFIELRPFTHHFMKNITLKQIPRIKKPHSFYWVRIKNY